MVIEELNDAHAKWYDIGLQLCVSVGTLDAIKEQYDDPSHCLRKTLTTWLKTCPSPPTWKNIVDALRSSTVGEVRLAADLEQKYCSTQDTSVAATHHLVSPPLVSLSQPHTQTTTLPSQCTVSTIQPPLFASSSYSVTPPSHPPPLSAPYYYPPHTGYPLYTPLPVTPRPSGVATASVHPSYSHVPQVTPTSSRPLLSSVPTEPTTPQLPTTLLQYPSPPSLTTIPPSTSPILPLATVTTSPDLPPLVTRHTLGMKISCSSQPLLFYLRSMCIPIFK